MWRVANFTRGRAFRWYAYAVLALCTTVLLVLLAGTVPYPAAQRFHVSVPASAGLSQLSGPGNTTGCGVFLLYTNDTLHMTFSTGVNTTWRVSMTMLGKFYNSTPVTSFYWAHVGAEPISVLIQPSAGSYLFCWEANSTVPQEMNVSLTHDYATDLSGWYWWT